jgi:ribosomal-protein-alanine N-acetyltransferase
MINTDDDPDLLAFVAHFPVLHTPRLTLRVLGPQDADSLVTLYSNPDVLHYYDAEPMRTLNQARDLIGFFAGAFAEQSAMRWAITRRGAPQTLIGTCGYHGITRRGSDLWGMVSYDLMPDHWGQGIMTEALHVVIEYGFDGLGLRRIEAETLPGNQASARVLEKLGFVEDANLPELRRWTLANSSNRSIP